MHWSLLRLYSYNIYIDVTADERCYSSITVNDVLDALKDITLGKHDGQYSLTSDMWSIVGPSRRFASHIVDPNVEHACSRIQCP